MVRRAIVFIIIIVLLTGCTEESILERPHDIAEKFLKKQGYTNISYEASADPYVLKREDLNQVYPMQIWQVQTVEVDDYLGKEINGENFIIQNHPLDNWESGTTKALGKTQVYLMVVDGEVIGGTSFPITKERLVGGPYSLDGKTFEELYPYENWREWADNWSGKYSD